MHASYTREELQNLKKQISFYCPQCQNSVQLKIGRVVIPHFAHLKNSSCQQLFSEGESSEHLAGKQQLYHLFNRLQLAVQLEPYLPELAQRPDLLVHHHHATYAIEFQCSTIPIDKIESRTNGYLQAGIEPIWLMKTPHFNKPLSNGVHLIQLSPFRQQFISFPKQFPTLITFDPATSNFTYFAHLLYIGSYRFIAKVQTLPIDFQHFPFLDVKAPSRDEFEHYWQLWKGTRIQFLKRRLRVSKKGVQDVLLLACYNARISLEQLPLFIGLPVNKDRYIDVYAAEWQALLYFFIAEKGCSIHQVDDRLLTQFMKRYPSFFQTQEARGALWHYIELLQKLQVKNQYALIDEKEIFQLLHSDFLAKRYEN